MFFPLVSLCLFLGYNASLFCLLFSLCPVFHFDKYPSHLSEPLSFGAAILCLFILYFSFACCLLSPLPHFLYLLESFPFQSQFSVPWSHSLTTFPFPAVSFLGPSITFPDHHRLLMLPFFPACQTCPGSRQQALSSSPNIIEAVAPPPVPLPLVCTRGSPWEGMEQSE